MNIPLLKREYQRYLYVFSLSIKYKKKFKPKKTCILDIKGLTVCELNQKNIPLIE